MIAIISDVHGNYPALKSVLDDIDASGCETIISLGDVAGYYCMVNQCIESLRFCNVKNLMGNHDKYLVSGMDCPRSKSANRIIEYQRQVITNENRKWLANSAMSLELDGLSLVHGGWDDPLEEYLYVVNEEYFAERSGVYFFSGHTHFQIYKSFSGKFYCNPGSVGQPRDGDSRAAYAIFDQGHVTLRRVNYKIDSIAEEMKKEGFEPYYYENLFTGSRIGGSIGAPSWP